MTTDIADLLRSMPDLEPPADGWRRIAAQQARLNRMRWGRGLATAASVVIAVAAGFFYLQQPELAVTSPGSTFGESTLVEPIIVSAPAVRSEVREVDPQVRTWQRRSQYMERLLSGLPARGRITRADTAGVIAELEDRIAAVDYQLNRAAFGDVARRRIPVDGPRYQPTDASDLWRRRVEFMDQLVRARYMETGVSGF